MLSNKRSALLEAQKRISEEKVVCVPLLDSHNSRLHKAMKLLYRKGVVTRKVFSAHIEYQKVKSEPEKTGD